MIEWTPSAREELDRHLATMRTRLDSAGADVAEVREDLRRHIDEEAASTGLGVVTAEEVGRILRQMGEPDPVIAGDSPAPQAARLAECRPEPLVPSSKATVFIFLFGVVLPAVTLCIESSTHMCAQTFFDPIPTFWHVLLVAAVPLVNLLTIIHAGYPGRRWHASVEWLNAVAIGVSIIYTLIFVPLLPLAVIAVILFGMGLLPMAPLFSLIGAIVCRRYLRRYSAQTGRVLRKRLAAGVVLGMVLFASGEVPGTLTRFGMQMAASGSPEEVQRGVRLLRWAGSRDVMLRACYERPRGATDLVGFILAETSPISTEKSREIFYRVTGLPFNAVPMPKLRGLDRTWDDEVFFPSFDTDLGGEQVGARVRNLSLASSQLDGIIDANAALGYLEWTLVFKNSGSMRQQEARAEVALPPGGTVSRLTLWVNGQEREAAFAGRNQTRQAYQGVVQQRRDPVLVTTRGPDRVLVQCFPVPINGEMKVRLGITLPVPLDGGAEAFVPLPRFVDRNFGVPGTLRHALWLESHSPIRPGDPSLLAEHPEGKLYALRGELSDAELMREADVIRIQRSPEAVVAWTADPQDPQGHVIVQKLVEAPVARPDCVVLVADGSRTMGKVLPQVAAALDSLPAGIELGLVGALDAAEILSPPRGESPTPYATIAEQLRKISCEGGRDNVPALAEAWELASARPNSLILWVHGPQPVTFDNVHELRQRWERRPNGPRLLTLQAVPGPSRVVDALDGIDGITSLPTTADVAGELKRLFAGWAGKGGRLKAVRERVPAGAVGEQAGKQTSAHLARLWAFDEVGRLVRTSGRGKLEQAIQLAAKYQIVTPVSGAVVLETQAQYDAAGLRPADPATVPSIPEPQTWAMLAVAAVVLGYAVYRRRQACSAE